MKLAKRIAFAAAPAFLALWGLGVGSSNHEYAGEALLLIAFAIAYGIVQFRKGMK